MEDYNPEGNDFAKDQRVTVDIELNVYSQFAILVKKDNCDNWTYTEEYWVRVWRRYYLCTL